MMVNPEDTKSSGFLFFLSFNLGHNSKFIFLLLKLSSNERS